MLPIRTSDELDADDTITFDLLLLPDAVDGSDTPIRVLSPSAGEPADGDTPADYTLSFTAPDLATFAAGLAGTYPQGATVVVPTGPDFGAYFITAASITQPWRPLDGRFAIPHPGYGGPESYRLFRRPDRWEWDTTIPLTQIGYSGAGLLYGTSDPDTALNRLEGILDRWRWVSAISTDPTFDPQLYVGAGNGPVPALDLGTVTIGGDIASLASDPAHAFIYQVEADGSLTEPGPSGVFNPPGNGYRVSLNAAGDPDDGSTFVWIDNDTNDRQRGNGGGGELGITGRWLREATPTPLP